MKTIILITLKSDGPWPFTVIDCFGNTYWTHPDRKAVTIDRDWMAITQAISIVEDYEASEWALIKEKIVQPDPYLIESNSELLLGNFIVSCSETSKKGYIDNDHGWIDSLESYALAITAGQSWLYTQRAPSSS